MNKALYDSVVGTIQERNPSEPLLSMLRNGYSPVNAVYLRAALRRLPLAAQKPAENSVQDGDTRPDRGPVDQVLRGLWGERTRLFGEMNKRSNHFHACKSDDERAANSRDIRRIWGLILEAKARIEYYEQHGALPEPVSEERFPLPEEPVALMKKMNSIRAQISQARKRLDDLGALPADHPDRVKIADAEARLQELKLYSGHAENAIKRASLHAG